MSSSRSIRHSIRQAIRQQSTMSSTSDSSVVTNYNDPIVLQSLPVDELIPIFEQQHLTTLDNIPKVVRNILNVPLGSDIMNLNLNPSSVDTEAWVDNLELSIDSYGLTKLYEKGPWPTSARTPLFNQFVIQLVTNLRMAFEPSVRARIAILRSSSYDVKQIVQSLSTTPFNPRSLTNLHSVRFNQPSASSVAEALTGFLSHCKAFDSGLKGGCYLGILRAAIAASSSQFDKVITSIIQPLINDETYAFAHPLDIHQAILNSADIFQFESVLQQVNAKQPNHGKPKNANKNKQTVAPDPSTPATKLAALAINPTSSN